MCPFLRNALESLGAGAALGLTVGRCFGTKSSGVYADDLPAYRRAVLVTACYHAARARHCSRPLTRENGMQVAMAYGRDVWPEIANAGAAVEVRAQHPDGRRVAADSWRVGRPPLGRSAPPSRRDAARRGPPVGPP